MILKAMVVGSSPKSLVEGLSQPERLLVYLCFGGKVWGEGYFQVKGRIWSTTRRWKSIFVIPRM